MAGEKAEGWEFVLTINDHWLKIPLKRPRREKTRDQDTEKRARKPYGAARA